MDYNEKEDVLWYMASGILTFFATSFVRFVHASELAPIQDEPPACSAMDV